MKAIVIERFGGPDVLQLREVARPGLGPDELLIAVRAVSVNRSFDLMVRAGTYTRGTITLPLILGADPSGIVAEIGEAVTGFAPGDRVAITSSVACGRCPDCRAGNGAQCKSHVTVGVHRDGGYADFVSVPARNVYKIPASLSFPDATFIVRHAPTAFHQLVDAAGLRAGEWVLVMGAAGALGSCGVQAAKFLGAKVIAAAGADKRVALARALGADFGINYRAQDLVEEVMRITGGEGVHVVMENISDPVLWPQALNALRTGGRMVTGGAHGGGTVQLDVGVLYKRRLRIIGAVSSNPDNVRMALEAAAQGRIRPLIDRVLPLAAAGEAHRLVEEGGVEGKVILDPTLAA